MKTNIILKGDCIEVMKTLPDCSVDLIFADPPYNMQTDGVLQRTDGTAFKGVDDNWDKFESLTSYDDFSKKWLSECKRILKDDGAIWVIGSFQNIFRLGYIMQDLGFWILNDVIWSKPNAVPNFGGTRFQNAHETLLWCSKNKNSKYHFNYQTMKAINGGKQMKSVWECGICIGNERLKDKNGIKIHSTQKPEALLQNVILASSEIGDVVLDPFFGTGTTGAVAQKYGRDFIGIEKDEGYIKAAKERLEGVIVQIDDYARATFDIKPPRIPMKKIVELGMLDVGQKLFNKSKTLFATVNKDGTLNYNDEIGSIHQIAAKMSKSVSCNGWSFFWCEHDNEFVTLDSLRYKANTKI